MAAIAVTHDTPTDLVKTAPRALHVTVDLTGNDFSIYCRINGGFDFKIVHGLTFSFDIAQGDDVAAWACGTGTINVTAV